MTRVLSHQTPKPSIPSLDDVQHFVIEDATWELYETLLRTVGNRPVRITYDNGRLEMMSPLTWHEEAKKIIARMIETLTLELDMKVKSLGSATFRRKDKARGLEPDECYYFKHEAKMRGKRRWLPSKDPVPELVVEIDITSRSIDRQPVYAALGVREIWRYDGRKIGCLKLAAAGAYHPRKTSRIFPFLTVSDLTRFIKMLPTDDENTIIRTFRDWVRQNGWTKSKREE
jgi:Uma2 family endonuclease